MKILGVMGEGGGWDDTQKRGEVRALRHGD